MIVQRRLNKRESKAEPRNNTVGSGAQATKMMFERQLAQMISKQFHLKGKNATNQPQGGNDKGDEGNEKKASLKIMQDSSG